VDPGAPGWLANRDQLRSARAIGSFIAALLFMLSVVAGAGVVMPPLGGVAMGVVVDWLSCVMTPGVVPVPDPGVVVCANTRPTEPTTANAAREEVMRLDVFMVDPLKDCLKQIAHLQPKVSTGFQVMGV
jgi:hypothetical protein